MGVVGWGRGGGGFKEKAKVESEEWGGGNKFGYE